MRPQWYSAALMLCAASTPFLVQSSSASPTECQEAISAYKSARSEILTALQSYANCVSNSDGHDDCSSEFEQLKSAQDSLEDAVSNYETECN
jgi:hypothetical protein